MQEHGGSFARCARVLPAVMALTAALPGPAPAAQPAPIDTGTVAIPDIRSVLPGATDREGVSATLQIVILLTVLSLAPAILIMTTSFTRIIIVLALLRQALGAQQLPPSQIIVGLALFLTLLIMSPVWRAVHRDAVVPWLDNAPGMTQAKALDIAGTHLGNFMFAQIEKAGNEEDIYLFYEYAHGAVPEGETITRAQIPMTALVPAFILSELKIAFVMGFRMYLPFLVIDMVIASILISMGMMMLPPVLISLPFKLLLFVLADGWHLAVGSILESFAT